MVIMNMHVIKLFTLRHICTDILPGEFLHDDAVVQIAAPSATKIWLRRDAQKAKITQFLPEGAHVPKK